MEKVEVVECPAIFITYSISNRSQTIQGMVINNPLLEYNVYKWALVPQKEVLAITIATKIAH